MNMYEQAIEGLEIERDAGLLVVRDGVDTWICEATDWDAARDQMSRKSPFDDEEDGSSGSALAYEMLCGIPGASKENAHPELPWAVDLVRRALIAGLVSPDEGICRVFGLDRDAR